MTRRHRDHGHAERLEERSHAARKDERDADCKHHEGWDYELLGLAHYPAPRASPPPLATGFAAASHCATQRPRPMNPACLPTWMPFAIPPSLACLIRRGF